ncbi:hypothetical protein ACIQVR_39415 [Streptomyces xanthochromogenes]|uniref:hypothetical protein n=1 Tax=Streptomyces xanthochromogenes TaxID=67384 RepID=UPI00380718AB
MNDEPEPVRCPRPGCRWSAAGIPDNEIDLRARIADQHVADAHVASLWDVTQDVRVVLDRLAFLLKSRVHGRCGSRGTQWLIRRAVYGGLWSADRIGEVPEADRERLRTLAADVTRLVMPGGVHARGATAAQVQAIAEENVAAS